MDANVFMIILYCSVSHYRAVRSYTQQNSVEQDNMKTSKKSREEFTDAFVNEPRWSITKLTETNENFSSIDVKIKSLETSIFLVMVIYLTWV